MPNGQEKAELLTNIKSGKQNNQNKDNQGFTDRRLLCL